MNQPGFDFTESGTAYLCRRLHDHRWQISLEGSDPRAHVQQIRAAIVASRQEYTIVGRAPDRKPETYAQAFERIFREPLIPKKTKGRTTTC